MLKIIEFIWYPELRNALNTSLFIYHLLQSRLSLDVLQKPRARSLNK